MLGLLAGGSAGCLLYTDHINHAPEVKLTGDALVKWGEGTGRYHAEAHDPDQGADSLRYEWRRQVGACPTTLEAAQQGSPLPVTGKDFENDVSFREGFCVWVIVSDDDRAIDWDKLPTQVQHAPSEAVIEVLLPVPGGDHFPLFSAIRVSGERSNDPEDAGPLALSWTLTRNGAVMPAQPCPDASPTDICFAGDVPGSYKVELAVKDARGGQVVATPKLLTVDEDAPPCIRQTDPPFGLARIVRDATQELKFQILSVDDDGDPFPAPAGRTSTNSFTATWWLDGEDSNTPSGRRPANQSQIAFVPFGANYFQNGDQAFVRLQVNDRVPRDFSACIRDKVDNCAVGKDPTCFQWVTWKIDFRLGGQL
jgi:hypothetical protein